MTARFLPVVIEPRDQVAIIAGVPLPVIFTADPKTAKRVIEFFAANIRNPNTRKAYARAAGDFAAWCEGRGLDRLCNVQQRITIAASPPPPADQPPSLAFPGKTHNAHYGGSC